jgi:hypothetical protein
VHASLPSPSIFNHPIFFQPFLTLVYHGITKVQPREINFPFPIKQYFCIHAVRLIGHWRQHGGRKLMP